MTLDSAQVQQALAALPAWDTEDGALVRGIPVTGDSRDGLIEAVGNAVADHLDHAEVHVQPDVVLVRVGSSGGVTPQDVELAARLDQVLDGSGRDAGS